MAFRYRDTETKRFVSKATWKRSKAHGGTRYKREKIEEKEIEEPRRKKPPIKPPPEPEPPELELEPEEEEEEWTGAFDTP